MINTKNRLYKLLNNSRTYQEFQAEAVRRSSWVLAPYVQEGHRVDKPWLEQFWKTNRRGL